MMHLIVVFARHVAAFWTTRRLVVFAAGFVLSSTGVFGGITLTWADNSADETGFRVERALADLVFVPLATVGANVTTYVDTTALPSTAYHYRIAAFNAAGASGYSNVAATVATATGNTAPTISSITDQNATAGGKVGPIVFTVGDAETAADLLAVVATSSNAVLVPTTGILLGGSSSSRTITITPTAGQTGTAIITVTVSDGVLLVTDAFVVAVSPANSAPTIADVPNQTIAQGGSTGPIAFTINDIETAAINLSVSATSSNPTLVPQSAITLSGSGTTRAVTIAPVATQSGVATITLSVSDGTLIATDTFLLSVTPVANTPPVISNIADQAVRKGGTTGPIAFTVSDAETLAGSLVLSATSSDPKLIPVNAIVFGGSGGNRSVTVTPAPNRTGTATITVNVSDGAQKSFDTFVVTVLTGREASFSASESITSDATPEVVQGDSVQLSTLGYVSSGDPLIVGFEVKGEIGRKVLLRGVGPGLIAFGVATPLSSPRIEIYDADGQRVGEAAAWTHDPAVLEASLRRGLFPLAANSADAAAVVKLLPGIYTAHVVNAGAEGGIALLDIVDAEDEPTARVVVASARAVVERDHALLTGLTVSGTAAKRILVRGIGPGLARFGVPAVLANPRLAMHGSGSDDLAAKNEGSATHAASESVQIVAVTSAKGLPALDPSGADSAFLVTLAPGVYTITLESADGERGSGMIEVFETQ
jgi:hypothetical protein